MATASAAGNRAWNLEAFLDSLIVELDKARDTLAIKAVTRPLTYSVQDIGLDLQIFPQFDGEEVRFVTARPGESGASGLKIGLGSITARSIQETTSDPITKDDISIDGLDEIDSQAKASLRKLGITSGKDLERLEERDVDLEKATDSKLDYKSLANVINRARRRQVAPSVAKVGLARSGADTVLHLTGSNLVLSQALAPEFPIALLNGRRVEVLASGPDEIRLKIDPAQLAGRTSQLKIACDPFAVCAMELNA